MAEGETPEAEDRELDASQRRLDRAREQGDVPLGRELVQVAGLGAGALALSVLGPVMGTRLVESTRGIFAGSHTLEWDTAWIEVAQGGVPLALGVAGFAALAAVAATMLQTGGLFSAKPLVPKPSKLSPLAGIKRMFGPHALQELARAVLKMTACGLALYWVGGNAVEEMSEALALSAADLAAASAQFVARLLAATLAVLAGIAALDFGWTRFRFMRRMRMSLKELKDEMKESDGDPHFRARRLQIMRSRSRRRMMAEVPKATVVVTNPTHYAVALAYERGVDAAPRVVARGVDAMAARIRAVAEEHGVPLVANPPLARALYRLEDDVQIPPEHFAAVAELIAMVWRMRGPR